MFGWQPNLHWHPTFHAIARAGYLHKHSLPLFMDGVESGRALRPANLTVCHMLTCWWRGHSWHGRLPGGPTHSLSKTPHRHFCRCGGRYGRAPPTCCCYKHAAGRTPAAWASQQAGTAPCLGSQAQPRLFPCYHSATAVLRSCLTHYSSAVWLNLHVRREEHTAVPVHCCLGTPSLLRDKCGMSSPRLPDSS